MQCRMPRNRLSCILGIVNSSGIRFEEMGIWSLRFQETSGNVEGCSDHAAFVYVLKPTF